MNMKQNAILSMVVAIVMLSSCSKDDAENDLVSSSEANDFTVEFLNANETIQFQNLKEEIQPISYQGNRPEKNEKASFNHHEEFAHKWEHVQSKPSPLKQLSAAHCDIEDGFAYIAYHTRGAEYLGMLEILKVCESCSENYLEIFRSILIRGVDLNAVAAVSPEEVWVAGSSRKSGAILLKINSVTRSIKTFKLYKAFKNKQIPPSANGISLTDSKVLVSTGRSRGGVVAIDRTTEKFVLGDPHANVKTVLAIPNTNDYISLIGGKSAYLFGNNINNPSPEPNIMRLGFGSTHRYGNLSGKNTLAISPSNGRLIYASLGENGLMAVNLSTGERVARTPPMMLRKGNTNAVSFDSDYIYMANGADGIAVADHELQGIWITPEFRLDLGDDGGSVNYLAASGNLLLVCSGKKGVDVLMKKAK